VPKFFTSGPHDYGIVRIGALNKLYINHYTKAYEDRWWFNFVLEYKFYGMGTCKVYVHLFTPFLILLLIIVYVLFS